VLRKPSPSAFFRTEFEAQLARRSVRRLTVVGLETHTSVLLTAADALSRGVEVVVPEPCVAAADPVGHAAALRLLRELWPRSWAEARTSESSRSQAIPQPTQPPT